MPVDINNEIIDLRTLGRVICENKWKFIILQIAVLALCSLYIIVTPKEYKSHIRIAPEISKNKNNMIENLLDLSKEMNMAEQDVDAVYPLMYPNILVSDDFIADLFTIKISTLDNKEEITYYEYLKNHYKISPLQKAAYWLEDCFDKTQTTHTNMSGKNIKNFNKEQERIASLIKDNMFCTLDRKMGILNLVITDQDPLVATIVSDSVTGHLRRFVTNYRTSKARIDYEFCEKTLADARKELKKAEQKYVDFSMANIDISRTDLIAKKQALEQEYNKYRSIVRACETQLYATQTRIQADTPAFSVISKPYIPHEASEPKPLYIIIYSLIVANLAMFGFIFRKRLIKLID